MICKICNKEIMEFDILVDKFGNFYHRICIQKNQYYPLSMRGNESPKNECESQSIATGGVGATPNTLDTNNSTKQELNKEVLKDYE